MSAVGQPEEFALQDDEIEETGATLDAAPYTSGVELDLSEAVQKRGSNADLEEWARLKTTDAQLQNMLEHLTVLQLYDNYADPSVIRQVLKKIAKLSTSAHPRTAALGKSIAMHYPVVDRKKVLKDDPQDLKEAQVSLMNYLHLLRTMHAELTSVWEGMQRQRHDTDAALMQMASFYDEKFAALEEAQKSSVNLILAGPKSMLLALYGIVTAQKPALTDMQ